jgi:hypothetical protein
MKALKYAIIVFIITWCLCLARILVYVFTDNVQYNKTNWNATTTQKVVDLPSAPYNCKKLEAVIGNNVDFCKLKIARPVESGKPYVMGDFNRSNNMIRITKETPNDSIVHEFMHYAISCTRATKDEELCVRSAQKMMLELDLIKL